ncbi:MULTISPECIES: phosphoribosylformylglycinamidine cyclo-ligase [unclassified Candidatus Frackibacter]|uniref:phosphoribosylformylglycinamidine cyclo-ligase n=1 Tax=unclassified Candidatus Frackibacter TaxID=2648818 RepID=UPI0008844AA5|nr:MULTISPECIES: phosphoribosylformylglycinamidine cyclo-ligase [unclassified Candidatus Frackibacter]SDC44764.1 phosphoribosylformylglycinamidine cyclo-ligase [Candidatus Frackibacter sp. WG11]SEM64769.1 phosphoribosylformylglycinamidine cyclo-ligase [Candidatus Frackibacter sp. WG12]SFL67743.1 phosphoribosylformylglycinamidine cyclo-ligase [Candidatus Frackibacter sp. WG13]
MGLSYKDAGVDIDAGEAAVDKINDDVKSTFGPEVLTGLGSFGALFAPNFDDYEEPILVAGTDGVGTKLKVAFMMDKHYTIGIDLVAMSVNDIVVQGARPLFFLDYLAIDNLIPEKAEEIVHGISQGCKEAGAALIGGEMAEMPGFYNQDEYDLAGFAVGIVDKGDLITGKEISPGDKIIGLTSNGIHSNGYSLARKVLFDIAGYNVESEIEELDGTLGNELLKPTKIYVKPILELMKDFQLKGVAHITGGGLIENVPRILPNKMEAMIDSQVWPTPVIFDLIQNEGEIPLKEMYRTFNMGIGMAVVVDESDVEGILDKLKAIGEEAYIIGEIKKGDQSVTLNLDT